MSNRLEGMSIDEALKVMSEGTRPLMTSDPQKSHFFLPPQPDARDSR